MIRQIFGFSIKVLVGMVLLLFYCEFLVYYIKQINCTWPTMDPSRVDKNIAKSIKKPVKIMVIADTHLLGSLRGHWFDKLRREWQMYRAFQTAITLHKPDVVFVLGDLLDEGQICNDVEFDYYIRRFYDLFKLPKDIQMHVVVGNHDIGFHYRVTPYLKERFDKAFNSTAVRLINIRGNNFVLVNSVALEGDGCFLCKPAEVELAKIATKLKCSQNMTKPCPFEDIPNYSRPILMQHYPLYRKSDEKCSDFDAAPFPEREEPFREKWECISKKATHQLLKQVRPRLVLSGHTHHGCTRKLPQPVQDGIEITIPSFSWRNKNNPNYLLGVFTTNNYAVTKCEMPRENDIINSYIFGFASWLFGCIIYTIVVRNKKKRVLLAIKIE